MNKNFVLCLLLSSDTISTCICISKSTYAFTECHAYTESSYTHSPSTLVAKRDQLIFLNLLLTKAAKFFFQTQYPLYNPFDGYTPMDRAVV